MFIELKRAILKEKKQMERKSIKKKKKLKSNVYKNGKFYSKDRNRYKINKNCKEKLDVLANYIIKTTY